MSGEGIQGWVHGGCAGCHYWTGFTLAPGDCVLLDIETSPEFGCRGWLASDAQFDADLACDEHEERCKKADGHSGRCLSRGNHSWEGHCNRETWYDHAGKRMADWKAKRDRELALRSEPWQAPTTS